MALIENRNVHLLHQRTQATEKGLHEPIVNRASFRWYDAVAPWLIDPQNGLPPAPLGPSGPEHELGVVSVAKAPSTPPRLGEYERTQAWLPSQALAYCFLLVGQLLAVGATNPGTSKAGRRMGTTVRGAGVTLRRGLRPSSPPMLLLSPRPGHSCEAIAWNRSSVTQSVQRGGLLCYNAPYVRSCDP